MSSSSPPTDRAARPNRRAAAAVAAIAALCLVLPTAPAVAVPTDPPGDFTSVNLAADRTSANFFYRIPALAHLGDGVVLASWDARPGSAADAPNPNSIMERRSLDNGQTWGPARIVAAGSTVTGTSPRFGYSDPSYVVDRETGTVFNFFVYSKDQGFFGSAYGNDDADRQVISSAVISSTDGGVTWSEPRLITEVTKPAAGTVGAGGAYQPVAGDVRANFATSGEGIQLRYGPHAGRLLQQYAGTVRQPDGSTRIQAYSVYSDDHGATWQRGEFVGTGMDENKVVELSDGRVMMNSRDSDNGRQRKVAISTDGGESYGPVVRDAELPDPTNNASIISMHPDAPQGSADAKKLLFTNANNGANGNRVNGAVRVSCDDGETWPGLRSLETGSFGYSTATVLDDGRFGVLWERNYTSDMQFSTFDEAWINYACAPLTAPTIDAEAGQAATLAVTIENQEAGALSGELTISTPGGWAASPTPVAAIAGGATAQVALPLTVPTGLQGPQQLKLAFTTADGRVSQATAVVELPITSAGLTLTSTLTSPARDVTASPYQAGDQLAYSIRVTSTSGFPTLVTPLAANFTSGFLPTACRWNNLPARGAYNCTTPRVTLTQADIDRGYFVPEYSMTVAPMSSTASTTIVTHRGAPVALRADALAATIIGTVGDPARDVVAQPYVVGDTVPYRFTVTNGTALTTTVTPVSGPFAPFVPPGPGNCRFLSLVDSASYDCTTPRYTVTEEDWANGFFVPESTWSLAAAGQAAQLITVVGDEVDLRERAASVATAVEGEWIDSDGDGWAEAGDAVRVVTTVTNTGGVRLTEVRAGDEQLDPLEPGASVTLESQRALTDAEVSVASAGVTAPLVTARNGAVEVTAPVTEGSVDLSSFVAPEWSPGIRYLAGDTVSVDGDRWIATRPTRGDAPAEVPSAWRPEGSPSGPGASWQHRRAV